MTRVGEDRRGRSPSHGGNLRPHESRAFLWGTGVLAVTTIHHVYGALLYGTPERYHAVGIGAVAFLVMALALRTHRAWPGEAQGRIGFRVFWGTTAAVPVLLFGVAEGLYNHVLKVLLFLADLPEPSFRRLYPEPTFEIPNDFVFEATGVLHVVPALLAGFHLVRLLQGRRPPDGGSG